MGDSWCLSSAPEQIETATTRETGRGTVWCVGESRVPPWTCQKVFMRRGHRCHTSSGSVRSPALGYTPGAGQPVFIKVAWGGRPLPWQELRKDSHAQVQH